MLEGRKDITLLSRYPPNGVLIPHGRIESANVIRARALHTDSLYPETGSLERLCDRYGGVGSHVYHLLPGSIMVIPYGMAHAALNLERCVSINSSYVQKLPEATVLVLDRTVSFFSSPLAPMASSMGKGFAVWVQDVVHIFLHDLQVSVAVVGSPGYASFMLKVGYCLHMAVLVERMVHVGCPRSSGINRLWRSALSARILATTKGLLP